MPNETTLQDLFLDELRDAYHAEKQLVKALPKMAKAATSSRLRTALDAHLAETVKHVERVEEAFGLLEEAVKAKPCKGMAGIIEEGSDVIKKEEPSPALDAAIIASGQRAEHYEMAAYGTLAAWATALGHDDVVDLLQQTLDEEKAADKKLTALAEGGINTSAAGEEDRDDEDEEEGGDDAAKPVRSDMSAKRGTSRGSAGAATRQTAGDRGTAPKPSPRRR